MRGRLDPCQRVTKARADNAPYPLLYDTMPPLHALTAALVLSGVFAGTALAADPLTDAVQAAYAPYRAALYLTNGKDAAEAATAVSRARQAWTDVATRFASAVPAPYQGDTLWPSTLTQVGAAYDKAASQVQAGQLAPAHETLEQVRDLLAGLRQRNGVVVYSDHMNAYHEEMEHVVVEGRKQLGDAAAAQALLARVGALDYLARRLRTQAPETLTRDAEFTALQAKVEESVATLKQALIKQDLPAAREAVGKVKGPYSRLFRQYG